MQLCGTQYVLIRLPVLAVYQALKSVITCNDLPPIQSEHDFTGNAPAGIISIVMNKNNNGVDI